MGISKRHKVQYRNNHKVSKNMATKQILSSFFILSVCIHAILVGATAIPGRTCVQVSTFDPRKQSQCLSRGGERGGATVAAVKTMPAHHMKLLK
jgi:hypothetical protein